MQRKWIYVTALLLLAVLWITLAPHTSVSAHSMVSVADTPTPTSTPDANAILNQANAANSQAQSLNTDITLEIGTLGVVLALFALIGTGLAIYGFTSFSNINSLKKDMATELEAMRNNAVIIRKDAKDTHDLLISLFLGDRLLSQGLTKEAIESYRKAGTFVPKDDQLNYALGRIYSSAGYFDDAITAFSTATQTNADYAEAWRELGLAYRRRGEKMHDPEDNDKAIEYLKKAITLNSDDYETYAVIGGLYRRKGEYQQALARYKEAHRLNPESPYPLGNMASLSLYLGEVAEAQKLFRETETAANARITAGKADIPWDYYDFALSQLGLGKSNVIDLYQRAIDKTPRPGAVTFESVLANLQFLQKAFTSQPNLPQSPDLPMVIQMMEKSIIDES